MQPTDYTRKVELFFHLLQNSRLRRRGDSLEQTLNAQLAESQEKLKRAEEKIKEQLAELKLNSAAKVEEIQAEAKKEIEALRRKTDEERKVSLVNECLNE